MMSSDEKMKIAIRFYSQEKQHGILYNVPCSSRILLLAVLHPSGRIPTQEEQRLRSPIREPLRARCIAYWVIDGARRIVSGW